MFYGKRLVYTPIRQEINGKFNIFILTYIIKNQCFMETVLINLILGNNTFFIIE